MPRFPPLLATHVARPIGLILPALLLPFALRPARPAMAAIDGPVESLMSAKPGPQ